MLVREIADARAGVLIAPAKLTSFAVPDETELGATFSEYRVVVGDFSPNLEDHSFAKIIAD